MKRFSTFVLTLLSVFTVYAQTISVSSFKLLETDLTANTVGTMETDQNGETAALIKVVTTQTGFAFDGGVLGIVKTKQTPGEIWVYIPRGSKKISVKHAQLGVLRDYYFPISIEAARTYEMVLVTGTIETRVNQVRTSQYVVFQLTPPNAFVEIDGEVLQTNGGTASKMMKFGTYNYRVQAPNYLPEAGNVTVNDPKNKHVVNVSLKPNFSVVTLKVDNEAEIWVNGERKGTNIWSGNLGAGTYEFETRKSNHRTTSVTRDITASPEPQLITLQAPTPILGEADISSSPAMADIYIDDKKVGKTPQLISDLIIGEHQIRIGKEGYGEYSEKIYIKEGETSILSVTLHPKMVEQVKEAPIISNNNSSNENIRTFEVGNVLFNMIFIEGGTFMMGATSEQGGDLTDEKPVHKVTLSPYYMGETEVTQELWEAVMGSNPSNFKGSNLPVEQVCWNDCQLFIRKLNNITGQNFRLPTEAEWEFASRGGNKSKGYKFSGSNNIGDVGWYSGNSDSKTHDVKTKHANELGLYDMSGNVWEWCKDWKHDYRSSAKTNPSGPISGSNRVLRSGSWLHNAKDCRVSKRFSLPPKYRNNYLGLRLVLQ